MSSPILPDETLTLIKKRDSSLITPPKDGTRRISLGLLSPPSSTSSRSASSASSTTTAFQTKFITIPTHLESPATFEFIGFTADRATKLFEQRASKPPTMAKAHILAWATEWIEASCADAQDGTDDWDLVMVQAGIKSDVRTALTKPEHSQILFVQSLTAWLREIVEIYYHALVDMNARVLEELDPEAPKIRGGGDEPYTVPNTPGGHLAVFKSVEFLRCYGCISQDGEVDLRRLESYGPTDFCRRGGLYFSHQIWVASHYSSLITDACPVADRRTVELHIPLSHFQAVKTWELKFDDDDLKSLLFHSRREQKYPKDLSRKRAAFGVIHGPIGHNHNLAFAKMKTPAEITDKHQLQVKEKVDSNDNKSEEVTKFGKQHVWIREEAIAQLEEDVRGKVYIRKPEQGFKLVPQPWEDTSVKLQTAL